MIDWLIGGSPRDAQLEALSRSYKGIATRDRVLDDPVNRRIAGHSGEPAKGWGHFLEMRVGKTPTFLNEFALLRRDYDAKWGVMFSPNAFKPTWALEAEKFNTPYDAFSVDSSNRKAAEKFIQANKKTGGLVVFNYEALKSEATFNMVKSLLEDGRSLVGADESVSIKEPRSSQTKDVLALGKLATWARALSGKPVVQGPQDLYTQLRFLRQLNGLMPETYRRTYCRMGGFQGKQIIGSQNEEQLQSILQGCSFFARKTDWLLDALGKDYAEPRKLQLLPDQLAMYKRMQKDFLVELADGTVVSADQIITKLIKMQQITSGFIIDEDGKTHDLMPPDKNPKVLQIREMLRNEISSKTIVICNTRRSMDILEQALAEFRPAVIRGDQWHKKNERDKTQEKDRFNNDPACRVIIGQEQAIRYGHTLMGTAADPCHTVIFYENNYSLNDRSQCEERPQGSGQTAPATIFDFIATDQDLSVIRALQRKEDISAAVLNYARDTGVLPR